MKRIFYTLLLLNMSIGFQTIVAQVQIGSTLYGSQNFNEFGNTVAISGDGNRIAAGTNQNWDGYVKIYDWDGSNWQQVGNTIFGDIPDDRFGSKVAISEDGNIIAISATFHDENGSGSGQVKVFYWDTNLSDWTQMGQDLYGDAAGDIFGNALDISADGSRLIIGADGNDFIATSAGQAKIFEWTGNSWAQMGNSFYGSSISDRFGRSVAISANGNVIAVGAPFNDLGGWNTGSISLYEWNGVSWLAKGSTIYGDNDNDYSGSSVDLSESGNVVAIGATHNNDGGGYSGQCKVFSWTGSNWLQRGVDLNGSASYNFFGKSVSISADGLFLGVGAYGYGPLGYDGQAKAFSWDGTQWIQVGSSVNPNSMGAEFGTSLSISSKSKRMVIGAPQSFDIGTRNGAVYVFEFDLTCDWQVQTSSEINGSSIGDNFSSSISYSRNGNFMIVGAYYNDENGSNAGKASVYQKVSGNWVPRGASLLGDAAGDRFGNSVAISNNGNLIAVGATYNDLGGSNAGSVKVFAWNGTNYIQRSNTLVGSASNDRFGTSISLNGAGNRLAVGAPYNDANGPNAGTVQVYTIGKTAITLFNNPIYGEAASDLAGISVELTDRGDQLAIGAPYNDGNGSNSGQVRVFINSSGTWQQRGYSINGDAAGDQFGIALSFSNSGSRLAVGAPFNDANGTDAGQVQVYQYSNLPFWEQLGQDLLGSNSNDNFGTSCDLSSSGNRIVVGVPYSDENGPNAGKAVVYDLNSNAWGQSANAVYGKYAGDFMGIKVCMSNNGTSYLISSIGNDENGQLAGQVRIFETCPLNVKSLSQNQNETEEEETTTVFDKEMIASFFQIYPNPTKGSLSWLNENQAEQSIQIFDNLGRLVKEAKSINGSIDVQQLNAGIYFIKILSQDQFLQATFEKL